MLPRRRETNPHFLRPLQPQHDDDHFRPTPVSISPPYEDRNLHPSRPVAPPHDYHFHPRSPVVPTEQHPGQQPTGRGRKETNPHFLRPLHPQHDGDHSHPPPVSAVPLYDDDDHLHPRGTVAPPVRRQSPISPSVPHIEQDRPPISPSVPHKEQDHPQMPSRPRGKTKEQKVPKRTKTSLPVPPKEQSAPKPKKTVPPKEQSPPKPTKTRFPGSVPPDTELGPRPTTHKGQWPHTQGGQRLPPHKKTKAHTWFVAVFCVIFWLIIIIGGLIVLIVYLVFRPQSPHFDVSSVTLNAAYLDLGYLLNADVTVLANFTNPNKKVHVHFSSMIIDLYYGSTLIATQYVEPFSAAKATSRFAAIHMVSSQVRLPLKESQRLMKQMETNGVLFEVKGIFRATSKLGSILTYSYNLYGLCNVMVTRPPDGVLIKRKCRTKR